jgi:branched-chain amino acid aminotransferase
MDSKFIWMDGQLVSWDDATVHVTSFGLHYGIGFFEGVRCHSTPTGPAIFRLTDHLQRLRRSAAIYGVQVPYSADELALACKSVVSANHLSDCYLRPLVFLGDGADPFAAKFRTAIIAFENGPITGSPDSGQGVRACVSSFHRVSANSIPPAAKATGQYLNSFLAKTEALRARCDEAILLNANGFVADGWAHNVFAVLNGAIVTPPVSAGALAGITRDTVLTLAAEDGLPAREQDLVRSDLYLADECFLTGTSAGIVPVVSIDGRPVGTGSPGPVASAMAKKLSDVMHGDVGSHPGWRESLD